MAKNDSRFFSSSDIDKLFRTIDVSAASLDMSEQSETDYDLMGNIWTGSGEVWSEPEYDGWQLTWSAGIFYDRLDRIEKDGIIYIYSYDDNGHRISKSSDGLLVTYEYNADGYLLSEKKEDTVIEYSYVYNQVTGRMRLYGFTYDGVEYVYEYEHDDAGAIIGIASEGNEVVRYTYNYGVCENVLGIDENGMWVEKSDDSTFVGNINPFRYTQKYLDVETGWYWSERYYAQADGRYIDGISDEKAEQLYELQGDSIEIYCKRYTVGADITGNNAVMSLADNADATVDYIAKVLYCESSAYIPDQQGVAWCIKSRMDAGYGGRTTAIGIVTYNNEFAGDMQHNDTNGDGIAQDKENIRQDFHEHEENAAWRSACQLAIQLNNGNNPTPYKPSGYTGQMFFRSIDTMTGKLIDDSGTLRLGADGPVIYSLLIIDFGNIASRAVLESSIVQGYSGQRNVFFKIK